VCEIIIELMMHRAPSTKYLCVSNDTNDGAVAFQLGKVLLNLLLTRLIRPLHGSLRERLLLGPVPSSIQRPRGRHTRPSRATIAAKRPQEGDTALQTHAAITGTTITLSSDDL